jgi:hypothetical protein
MSWYQTRDGSGSIGSRSSSSRSTGYGHQSRRPRSRTDLSGLRVDQPAVLPAGLVLQREDDLVQVHGAQLEYGRPQIGVGSVTIPSPGRSAAGTRAGCTTLDCAGAATPGWLTCGGRRAVRTRLGPRAGGQWTGRIRLLFIVHATRKQLARAGQPSSGPDE